jgi:hypothetical protein
MFDVQGHVQRSKFASGAVQHGVLEISMARINLKVLTNSKQGDMKPGRVLAEAIRSHQMLIGFFHAPSPILAVV